MSMFDQLSSGDWKHHRKLLQEERAERARVAREFLKEADIPYLERNMGYHLIVKNVIDFWPTTGKWRTRSGIKKKASGASLESMIKYMGKRKLL